MKIENNVIIGGPLDGLKDEDTAWLHQIGNVTVNLRQELTERPLCCVNNSMALTYLRLSGKYRLTDKHQSLYFSQPIAPSRPKKMVPKTIDVWITGDTLRNLSNDGMAYIYNDGANGSIPAKLTYEAEE